MIQKATDLLKESIESKDLIRGEDLQQECQIYIGLDEDFKYNPIHANAQEKWFNIETDVDICAKLNGDYPKIFCYTHVLEKYLNKVSFILSAIDKEFCLVCHNSDHSFTQKYYDVLLTIGNLKMIYSQNPEIIPDNGKLIPLPIGLANRMWPHSGTTETFKFEYIPAYKKSNFIYAYFSKTTLKRDEVENVMDELKIPSAPVKPYDEYIKLLSSYRYALCPEGNGIDTHRFWECLYVGTTPICLKNALTEYYSKIFDIVLLDKWSDLRKLLEPMQFDIVTCLGPNDKDIIHDYIEHNKKNVVGYRNYYVISYDSSFEHDGVITIPESRLGVDKEYIASIIFNYERSGWYLQQLLKLNAGDIIEELSENYLVIDADTYFNKPISFLEHSLMTKFGYSCEYNVPYFEHMLRLHPQLKKRFKPSAICHHMMFSRRYLSDLREFVLNQQADCADVKLDFNKVFIENVNFGEFSGASEYEMYVNFLVWRHPNAVKMRHLNHFNVKLGTEISSDQDIVSTHHYMNN
jgi:hypothetical protein